jgi:hypothetical protein
LNEGKQGDWAGKAKAYEKAADLLEAALTEYLTSGTDGIA